MCLLSCATAISASFSASNSHRREVQLPGACVRRAFTVFRAVCNHVCVNVLRSAEEDREGHREVQRGTVTAD